MAQEQLIRTVRLNKAASNGKGILYITIPINNNINIKHLDKVIVLPVTYSSTVGDVDIHITNKEVI